MFNISGTLPKLLKLPEKNSYSFEQGTGVISTDFDGVSNSRQQTINNFHKLKAEWHLTSEEYDYFQGFFEIRLNKGMYPFLLDLIIDTPNNQEYACKFVADSIQITEPTEYSFVVNAELEVYPNNNKDYQALLVLIYEDSDAIYSLIDRIDQFANVDCDVL